MLKFIIHRLKKKIKNQLTDELVVQKALRSVMPLAQEKTQADICQACPDKRCLMGENCREFTRRSESYAWELMASNAKFN